ncbi:MAG: hypothetical protein K0R17_4009, partial [Rariglobus sp.]|nr:hypothetical protein [Rariglobus sp.]
MSSPDLQRLHDRLRRYIVIRAPFGSDDATPGTKTRPVQGAWNDIDYIDRS